ncbi:Oidioi.mRNA.OKI2018_I69.chr2.g5707.t1.cds [Oikopleura dioica]|uniref:Oidioi.mRNA.OKI2018_I69.chr2.g5707.t1.cds n=1 Tax=Oikopleura dioica TaxID=34765 RepID=A0ABN7T6S6_OIKDI|nr:Oidioi.mRNA.OKI2018_I69.chr2.g5707.t1.cds [Oikopleura dioica]
MKTVETYKEIEKRLEQISNDEMNDESLPHQNMLFITKHEKEKPGRMRIVQDTSYWFRYPDGLRKFKVGPIQDENQPEDIKSDEFPIGLQCRDPACAARGVIYVTDADLRGEKRTYNKVGNHYRSSDCDIDQTYPKRSLFECYSRVSINGDHSCKGIKMKDGLTDVVRDHILAREKMPDFPEEDEYGYYVFTPIEDKVNRMIDDEDYEMRKSEHKKLCEIDFDEKEIGRICKIQLKRLEFQESLKKTLSRMQKIHPGVCSDPANVEAYLKMEELPLGASYCNTEETNGKKKKAQKSKKKKTPEDQAWKPGSSTEKSIKKKKDRKRKQTERADEDSAEEGPSKKRKPKKS